MTTLARRSKAGATAPADTKSEPTSGRRGRRGSATRSSAVGAGSGGWGGYDEKRRNTSAFAEKFSPTHDVEYLIKFQEDGPVDVYLQHWIREAPEGVKKSYVCYLDGQGDEADEEDCPMDAEGDKPSTQTLFNIINLGPEGKKVKPESQVWHITSVTVSDKIKRLSESRRSSPLNREDLYFVVKANKKARKVDWDIEPIKAEDLADTDWNFEPFTAKELEKWAADGIEDKSGFLHVDTRDELLDVVDKYF